MASLSKHRSLSTLLFVHTGRQDKANRRIRETCAQRRQLAKRQQSQPTSHMPAPLRTPLRLLPRQVSLDRYYGFVLVRRRQSRPLYAHLEGAALLFADLQTDGEKVAPVAVLRDVMRGILVPPTTT